MSRLRSAFQRFQMTPRLKFETNAWASNKGERRKKIFAPKGERTGREVKSKKKQRTNEEERKTRWEGFTISVRASLCLLTAEMQVRGKDSRVPPAPSRNFQGEIELGSLNDGEFPLLPKHFNT